MHSHLQLFAEDYPAVKLERTLQMPYAITDTADSVDNAYYFVYWINVFFLVFNTALMVWFVYKYRRKTHNQPAQSEVTHHTALELFWSIVPLIIVIFLGFWGVVQYLDMVTPPKNCIEVDVIGQKWNWTFKYNQGKATGLTATELHVVKGTPIKIRMTSKDVTHSLYIPVLRQKKDCLAGRYTYFWFNAKYAGDYDIFCTEYCGDKHSEMVARFKVHDTQAQMDAWVDQVYAEEEKSDPYDLGAKTFITKGCSGCHSLDGAKNTGPTFRGLYGRNENVTDREKGAMTIKLEDEASPVFSNYVRESILDPNAKVVQGFQPNMPSFKGQLRETQLRGLIEYLKWHDRLAQRPKWVAPVPEKKDGEKPKPIAAASGSK